MNTDHLDRIRELSASLELPSSRAPAPGVKQYTTIYGHVLAWTIHWQEEFAIMHIFLSEGTKLKAHLRDEKEWIIVISGELTVILNDREIVIQPQYHMVLESQIPHEILSKIDTYVVSITMPASHDWPKR